MTPWHGKEYAVSVRTAGAEIVTLEEVKTALNITTSDEDSFVQGLIATAMDLLDGYDGMVGKCLVNTALTYKTRTFETHMALPGGNVSQVTEIRYVDGDGADQTYDVGNVVVVSDGDRSYIEPVAGQAWPSVADQPHAIEIDYTAGFGASAASVPAAIKQAAILLVGHYYEHREAVTTTGAANVPKKLEMGVESLIAKHKIGWVAS